MKAKANEISAVVFFLLRTVGDQHGGCFNYSEVFP